MVVEVDRRRPRELTDVGAGRERFVISGKDDAANLVVPVQLTERRDELLHQLVRERVERVGPVQPDDRNRSVPLGEDEVAHFLSRKRLIAAFGSSVAIESASQSRAWLIVSCHARSFQKFRCCFA